METRKSHSEHIEYLHDSARLMLWFSFGWRERHADADMREILSKKTMLLELAGVKNIKNATRELLDKLAQIFEKNKDSAKAFEDKAFLAIRDLLEKNASVTYEKDCRPPEGYNAGSLKYDAPLKELPPNHCNFHIANAVCPKSIFADREYLAGCFMELMDKSEKEHGYDTLRTFTWLNSHPKWLEYFPEEWLANMGPSYEDVADNLGLWGQILTARKTFNSRTAEHIRKNFEMKYKPRASWCLFSTMRRHLENFSNNKPGEKRK